MSENWTNSTEENEPPQIDSQDKIVYINEHESFELPD